MKKFLFCQFTMVSLVWINTSCDTPASQFPVVALPDTTSQEQLLSHGKYISLIGGCNDCHSPKIMTPEGPVPDTTRLLSGHPANDPLPKIVPTNDWVLFNHTTTMFVGPWGITYGANLTPDDTGIGNWTLDQFKTALRKGKYKGLETARPLLPPMPWQMFRHMNDYDVEALFTYLRSLPPVENVVPAVVAPDKITFNEMARRKP
jgi:hypothetical protein